MPTPLCDLCVKYGTDKGPRSMNGWGYSPIYDELLRERRHEVKRVLEVGICGHRDIPNNRIGASLFVWHDYFPNAEIVGVDNDGRWMVHGVDRIKTYCFDAYDRIAMWKFLQEQKNGFDFIVDDAVHDPLFQILLLSQLHPALAENGIYAMEDVCPYKVPQGDLTNMARFYPSSTRGIQEFRTHKDERLIIIR